MSAERHFWHEVVKNARDLHDFDCQALETELARVAQVAGAHVPERFKDGSRARLKARGRLEVVEAERNITASKRQIQDMQAVRKNVTDVVETFRPSTSRHKTEIDASGTHDERGELESSARELEELRQRVMASVPTNNASISNQARSLHADETLRGSDAYRHQRQREPGFAPPSLVQQHSMALAKAAAIADRVTRANAQYASVWESNSDKHRANSFEDEFGGFR